MPDFRPWSGATSAFVRRSHYTIYQSGSAVYAVNGVTGTVDFSSISGADPAPVFQSAANALAQANGGAGGLIEAKGLFIAANSTQFQSPLVLPPGVGLVGEGPLNRGQPQATGTTIDSTYNGSVITCTGNANGDTFPYIADIVLRGVLTNALQNGIECNSSGGALKDVILKNVLIFQMGQHGIVVSAGKVWGELLYLESNQGDGANLAAGTIDLSNCYIFGSTGNGVNAIAPTAFYLRGCRIWNNAQANAGAFGLYLQATNEAGITECSFHDNGSNNNYAMQTGITGSARQVSIIGNAFNDSRGATAVNRFAALAVSHLMTGAVIGNSFVGAKAVNPLFVGAFAGTQLNIAHNNGYNDTVGSLATPFTTAGVGHIGVDGTTAVPVASTAYTAATGPLFLAVSGGVAVSITIRDPAGVAVQTGLASYVGQLPAGYSINLGAFTTAPTVYAGVA